ncbi:MAG: AMP-binding protein [Treponema sp.]|jgi:long-chain acyl-CoA synthetase|nr:AMP-binding protein [Treponema sp.]
MKYSPEKTLAALCLASSAKYKDSPAFVMLSEGKISRRVTYAQMGSRARQIGRLLNTLGIEKGDRVLILSENCPEWPLAYFGIAFAGAVSVPLLTGFSSEQIRHIASCAGISAVCLSRAMAEKIEITKTDSLFSQIPFIYIDSITDGQCGEEISVAINGNGDSTEKRMSLRVTEESAALPQSKADDLAAIIYTSGTSGNSKGVMLSGANIISCAISSLSFVKLYPRDRLLSVLPLAHSYECSLGLIAPIISGSSVTYLDKPPSPSVLLPAVRLLRPTVMVTVPLLIEKIYKNAIVPKLRTSRLYKFPLTRGIAVKFAGRKLVSALGGRIRFFGIGGAPLSPEVENFLYRARFPYSIGYGLTEAAPLVAGNAPLHFKINSGISAANGVTFRIAGISAGEGEIQVRGPNVMMGYYNDKEKTAEAFTSDGWLHTGDFGSLDKKGRLHIRGRLKALLLGPSGENIYPEEIEGLLSSSRLVEDALVYTGEKGELVAMVSLSEAAKAAAGAIENALEELRSWVNKKLAVFSRLSRIEIRHEPFEKTPTMKIKRYLYD